MISKRVAWVLVVVTFTTPLLAGCERLAGTNAENVALMQKHYDSVIVDADTTMFKRTAADDSLFAIREVQRRTDSIMRLTQPDLAPPSATPTAGASSPAALSPSASTPTPPTPRMASAATVAPPISVPVNPGVTTGVQRQLERARAMGDSIANAQVNRMVGQNRAAAPADSARGVVALSGSAPGTRAVLMVDGGRTTVALTGIGVEGLSALVGAEVVVRGMRVSPRDIVVSAYMVRAVKGFAVLDGVLRKNERGAFSLELTDKSGTRPLSAVPPLLQPAVGSRIWIDVNNGARPQTYGVIAGR